MTTLANSDASLLIAGNSIMAPGLNAQWMILKATANNQDSVARTVTVYRIPAGGSAGVTNIVVDALSLDAGETRALPLSGQTVVNGQVLWATASADNVINLNVGYVIQDT